MKFIIVGGFGAICYFLGSYCLTKVGFDSWSSSAIAYTVMFPIIFFWQKNFVFNCISNFKSSFFRYSTLQIILIFIAASMPYICNNKIPQEYAFISVIIFNAIFSFFLQKYWVFK